VKLGGVHAKEYSHLRGLLGDVISRSILKSGRELSGQYVHCAALMGLVWWTR